MRGWPNSTSLVAMYGVQWLQQQKLEAGKDFELRPARSDMGVGRMLLAGEAAVAVMGNGEMRALRADESARLKVVDVFARIPNFMVLAPGGAAVGDIAPALVEDIGLIFRQLGVESCRASVVDMGSLAFQGVWAVSDSGEAADLNPDLPLDSQFPGAVSSILQLAQAGTQDTVVQRPSPRHWSLAWRIDD